jgi:hypothetical protein
MDWSGTGTYNGPVCTRGLEKSLSEGVPLRVFQQKGNMINFVKQDNGEYKVFYENGVYMGDLSRAHDLLYNFWPDLKGGFWPAHVLFDISVFLDVLNKPIEDEYNEWCAKEAEAQKLSDGDINFNDNSIS